MPNYTVSSCSICSCSLNLTVDHLVLCAWGHINKQMAYSQILGRSYVLLLTFSWWTIFHCCLCSHCFETLDQNAFAIIRAKKRVGFFFVFLFNNYTLKAFCCPVSVLRLSLEYSLTFAFLDSTFTTRSHFLHTSHCLLLVYSNRM